jgi:hypothetical protein
MTNLLNMRACLIAPVELLRQNLLSEGLMVSQLCFKKAGKERHQSASKQRAGSKDHLRNLIAIVFKHALVVLCIGSQSKFLNILSPDRYLEPSERPPTLVNSFHIAN